MILYSALRDLNILAKTEKNYNIILSEIRR